MKSCNIPIGSVLRSFGAFQGNIWSVAPFIPVGPSENDKKRGEKSLFLKKPSVPDLYVNVSINNRTFQKDPLKQFVCFFLLQKNLLQASCDKETATAGTLDKVLGMCWRQPGEDGGHTTSSTPHSFIPSLRKLAVICHPRLSSNGEMVRQTPKVPGRSRGNGDEPRTPPQVGQWTRRIF